MRILAVISYALALVGVSLVQAQGPEGRSPLTPPPAVSDILADQEWTAVSNLLKPVPSSVARTPAQAAVAKQQRVSSSLVAAQQARSFYQRFPSHPNAGTARKIEVLSLLTSVRHGNKASENEALSLATSVRQDKSLFREDRFDVALAADRHVMRERTGTASIRQKQADFEALADKLAKEFGPAPEVFGLYLGIAKEADMETANRIATKVLEMRPPRASKENAEAITFRYAQVGHPVSLQLTDTEGKRVMLSPATVVGSRTVIYAFGSGTDAKRLFAPLDLMKSTLARSTDIRWVYVAMGNTSPPSESAKKHAPPFSGIQCVYDPKAVGVVNRLLTAGSFPMVFVLDGRGLLVGYGRPDELPRLLAAANK